VKSRKQEEAQVNLDLVRQDLSQSYEHVTRNQESCFTGKLLCRCLFARTEKMFFASSSAATASLEEQSGHNERMSNSMRSIFPNGWDK
jgi:hypothetical protein